MIFSHSSARAICDVPRNVPDDVLLEVKKNGGVVMVTFVPGFIAPEAAPRYLKREAESARLKALPQSTPAAVTAAMEAWDKANPAPKATLAQVADHIDHIRKVAGVDHIGIGGDFDGITDGQSPGSRTSAHIRRCSPSCCAAATARTTCRRSPAATCCA